ncbi:hypothetical protein M3P05_05035 [Sansalvadorimonas sp. 2012CJ34-2]|uniref:Uncharacterized protein n=1 Tax=Parendozoicomonas callyspongiae TaxID=2942213 RepID=A0ABT0PFJ2_9GAMM|nr:hypothetical protein [Sansalvadorimonas sp. 2012CJ34-2]MCL6269308.1 hypothetical protein [Sansalvadorimonas sp. 2012CJ34-2]
MRLQYGLSHLSCFGLICLIALLSAASSYADQQVSAAVDSPAGYPVNETGYEKGESAKKQTNSIIHIAKLVPGESGSGLELEVNAFPVQIPKVSSIVAMGNGGILKYYPVPDSDDLEFADLNGIPGHLIMQRARVAFGEDGQLEDIQFPTAVQGKEDACLMSALEQALKALASHAPEVLLSVSDRSIALVNARRDCVEMTVYRDESVLSPLAEVHVFDSGLPVVNVLDSDIYLPDADWQEGETTKSLNIVGLVEYLPQRGGEGVKGYLGHVITDIATDGIIGSKVPYLGYGGELAWGWKSQSAGRDFNYGGYNGRVFSSVFSSSYIQLDVSSSDTAIAALRKLLLDADSTLPDKKAIQILLPRNVYDDLKGNTEVQAFTQLSADLEAGQYPSLNKMLGDGQISYVGRASRLTRYLAGSVGSAAVSGVFGGILSAGNNVYNRYGGTGKLPHNYSNEEMHELVSEVGHDSARHAVTGLAVYNLQQVMPAFAAATVAGVGNHVYDSYRQGNLTLLNAPAVVAGAGAESLVAGVSGLTGSWIGGSIPLINRIPGASLTGSLVGSLAGHYAYQYAMNNDAFMKLRGTARLAWSGVFTKTNPEH